MEILGRFRSLVSKSTLAQYLDTSYNTMLNNSKNFPTNYEIMRGDVCFILNKGSDKNTNIAKSVGIVTDMYATLDHQYMYLEVAEVESNKVSYTYYLKLADGYFKITKETVEKIANGGKNPVVQTSNQILGFYPTSIYN